LKQKSRPILNPLIQHILYRWFTKLTCQR